MGCLKLTYHPKEDSEIKNLLFLQKDAPSKNFFLAKKCLNEYQYHLKDHLGNVRTTFAVRDDAYNTSFEVANPYFDNYNQIEIIANNMSKTGGSSNRVASFGASAERIGITKSFLVSAGDRVNASVYAKYLEISDNNETVNALPFVNALAGMLSGGVFGLENPISTTSLENGLAGLAASGADDDSEPEAYFNYILFDKSFNYVNGGFRQVTSAASDDGTGSGTHELLAFEDITIPQDGYIMIFVSNESESLTEVYFDDLMINHHKTEVVQADDYYPFGLTFNSYTKDFSQAQNYKYNGKEEQVETGWLDYGARMYMPDLGRFFNVDRFANKYMDHNPYHYTLNNPIKYVDINGDSVWTTTNTAVDGNGNSTVTQTVNITGKVLKEGGGSQRAGDVANGVNSRLNSQNSTTTVENGDGTTTTYVKNINANFTSANSMEDVSSSDHLLVVVDNVEGKADPNLGGGDAVGLAGTGKIGYVEGSNSSSVTETGFHEVGHMLGLSHPKANNSNNPMSYTGRGANFSAGQMSSIVGNSNAGYPNRGKNRAMMSAFYPNLPQGSFDFSTNNRPFQSAPGQRAIIPLPLINKNK